MTNLKDLSSEQLRKAAGIKDQIAGLERQLQALLNGNAAGNGKVKKGAITAAGRARIGAASRARWAKIRATKANTVKPSHSAKKTMSPAARAKISAAAKARWARIKAAKAE